MIIPSSSNQLDNSEQYTLPQAVFTNHSIAETKIEGIKYLYCSTPNCKFAVSVENAINYKKNNDTWTISCLLREIINQEAQELKQRVINKFLPALQEKDLIQAGASAVVEDMLNKDILIKDAYTTTDISKEAIAKNIDKLNQICPFIEENFKVDFYAGKYIDKPKLICPCAAEDFKNKVVKDFIADNIDMVKSFLNYMFFKNIAHLSYCRVNVLKDSVSVALTINTPTSLVEHLDTEYYQYGARSIEKGENGSDAFKNLELKVITDIATLKLQQINDSFFNSMTHVYICYCSAESNIINIHSYSEDGSLSEYNINLTDVIDTTLCEIKTDKLKEHIEAIGISYDDLLSETVRAGQYYYD